MGFWEALVLGTVQGLTEFIPVSSSGHLVLAEALLGLKVEMLKAFDVMVHMGTLVAIFAYFWKDFWEFILAVWHLMKRTPIDKVPSEVRQHQRWLGYILLATVPAGVIGILFEDSIDKLFRSPVSVALWMIAIGAFFLFAEWRLSKIGRHKGKEGSEYVGGKLTLRKAMAVGFAQALALIPGVSRSGSTIASAIGLGISREKAAKFSFLLGSPAIFGAGLVTALKLFKNGFGEVGWEILTVGFVSSAIVGYVCIAFLMSFLKKHTLQAFAVYLFVIGFVVLGYSAYF